MPHYAVKAGSPTRRCEAIFDGTALSPERMRAYFSKAKHLPAKTTNFVQFLRAAVAAR